MSVFVGCLQLLRYVQGVSLGPQIIDRQIGSGSMEQRARMLDRLGLDDT